MSFKNARLAKIKNVINILHRLMQRHLLLLRPEQALGSPVQDLCLTRDFSGVLVMDFAKVENSLAWGRHFFLVWLKKIYDLYTKKSN